MEGLVPEGVCRVWRGGECLQSTTLVPTDEIWEERGKGNDETRMRLLIRRRPTVIYNMRENAGSIFLAAESKVVIPGKQPMAVETPRLDRQIIYQQNKGN